MSLDSMSFSYLRTVLDGSDSFVSGGHQIIKTAGATRHADRMKKVPAWALDDEKIKEFIQFRFPKAGTDPEQRRLASRMIRLIHLYYRVGETLESVAGELKMTRNAVYCIVYRLNKAMSKPLKPSHRKKGDYIQTTDGTPVIAL
jgi:hypothetical protein